MNIQLKELGVYDKPRFVGGRCRKVTEVNGLRRVDVQTQLFFQLPGQGVDRQFMGLDLATRLHERRGAALAHQQRAAVRADQQGGGDADDPGMIE
ncbi:hypothetical protein D3C85_1468380 [compost metagenome]